MNNITQNPTKIKRELVKVDEFGRFVDDSLVPEIEIGDEDANNSLKFGDINKNKVIVNLHLSGLLRYGSLLQVKHIEGDDVSFRRLRGTEVLIIMELFDNFKYYIKKNLGFSPTSEVLLARAADVHPSHISRIIPQLFIDKFCCPFCLEEFSILIQTDLDVAYMKNREVQEGRRGYGYILKGVVEFIAHLGKHEIEDKKAFDLKREILEVSKKKRKMSEKSLNNLKKGRKVKEELVKF